MVLKGIGPQHQLPFGDAFPAPRESSSRFIRVRGCGTGPTERSPGGVRGGERYPFCLHARQRPGSRTPSCRPPSPRRARMPRSQGRPYGAPDFNVYLFRIRRSGSENHVTFSLARHRILITKRCDHCHYPKCCDSHYQITKFPLFLTKFPIHCHRAPKDRAQCGVEQRNLRMGCQRSNK